MYSERLSHIFLLSHMRAFTSLLGHILGSHPSIIGYFELHISYSDASAPHKALEELRKHEALKPDSRYLFDKLLHNDYRLIPDRLGLDDLKILVALREPARTIKSILQLFETKGCEHRYAQPKEALRYYIDRLEWLAEFCLSEAGHYYYFDAESVQRKPDQLLPALTRLLDLEPPLSERYSTFSQTGKPRKGDSSPTIQSGHIHKSGRDYSHIALAPALLEEALKTYRQSRQVLITNAADCVLS